MATRRKWLAAAVGAQAVEASLALAAHLPSYGLALLGPLLAAHRLSVRVTAVLGVVAVALTLLGTPSAGPGAVAAALNVAAVSLWAVFTARTRARAECALDDVTRLAVAAQEALARPLPDRVGHVDLAAHTRSFDPHGLLGGDVHDVVLTAAGPRLLLADVKGHGAQAMRVAAAVLAAFRGTAATEPDPVRLVHALDERLRPDLGPEDFVTLLLVDFRPGEARIVNCGHPAPLRTGRRLCLLAPPRPSPPLGLGPTPSAQRVRLSAGQRLLLYTDGLTDARDGDRVPFRLDAPQVHAALAQPALPDALECLTGLVRRHTGGAPLVDDLTVVLAQPTHAFASSAPEQDPGSWPRRARPSA
ncbi:PP2C family protein-serine/threonine phosphatase [Streptomyces flavofungini]|uniref:PP2C family protein-serine/threonine phosphatase n=1 Tax=Streptomyces flavofungini TaxID=68200 RepID=UPI0025B2347A|nr:PP2C family protein-serine/threonine phosphatase [Streptomyces flavofungini]WJV47359.1 PP2C family protein-serine/threonine phosphatase [Streptomyces flavofungini]